MFGSAMYSLIACLSRMVCQASRIGLCHHANDLSKICTLQIYLVIVKHMVFGQQRILSNVAIGPLHVLLNVFLVRVMSDQCKHNQSLHLILYKIHLEASFLNLSFNFLKCT